MPVPHGGDLTAARTRFPDAPEPLIDLSTGINPHAYPLPTLPPELFARLPEPAATRDLAAMAAEAYGLADPAGVVVAPGTQILLPLLASTVPPGTAAILGPTYAEHRRSAELAGHRVADARGLDELLDADLAVLVNPNNPDGRLIRRGDLRDLLDARALRRAGRPGLLVVDEAFMDVAATDEGLAPFVGRPGLAVLRSFGKFHGLAGVRLGFALAEPAFAAAITSRLGPWAVSGPALRIGSMALADRAWAAAMRRQLAGDAAQLDALLGAAGLRVIGGTSLFRFVATPDAAALWERLGRAGILVRAFEAMPGRLRFGLPGSEAAWQRLAAALAEACAQDGLSGRSDGGVRP